MFINVSITSIFQRAEGPENNIMEFHIRACQVLDDIKAIKASQGQNQTRVSAIVHVENQVRDAICKVSTRYRHIPCEIIMCLEIHDYR